MRRFFLILTLAVRVLPSGVNAHGGGLDGYGCHHNRKLGGYHCHRGSLKGQTFATKTEMLKALKKG